MTTTYTLDEMLTLIVIVSFLGFCLENVWLALRKGYIDNRNMHLPFLLGYGLAVSGGYLVFGLPDAEHLERYWITAFIAVSVGEILLGTATEHFCGYIYWDYSSIPMHITRYTSVPTSFAFACIITLFMGKCFTPLMLWISMLPSIITHYGFRTIFLLIAADWLRCSHDMRTAHALNERWRITLSARKQTNKKIA